MAHRARTSWLLINMAPVLHIVHVTALEQPHWRGSTKWPRCSECSPASLTTVGNGIRPHPRAAHNWRSLMDYLLVHVLFEEHFQLAASKLSRYGRPESVAYRHSDIPKSYTHAITKWSTCMALFIGAARCEVRLPALLHSEDQNTSVA